MDILMCRPTYFSIDYEINPWMDIKNKTINEMAIKQWSELRGLIELCGANVRLIEGAAGLPDMCFTANAGIVVDENMVIIANFKHKERQGESEHYAHWFRKSNYEVMQSSELSDDNFAFEGAGDSLSLGNYRVSGYGFRSDKPIYERIAKLDQDNMQVLCHLVNPQFYHIDTCFCPLDDSCALWYSGAFDHDSQSELKDKFDLLDVPLEEAQKFACNAVVINKNVIIPKGTPVTQRLLTERGYNVFSCDMSEFMKSGGACKCLTLRIN